MRIYVLIFLVSIFGLSYSHPITVDGNDNDWVGTPGANGTLVISGGEAIYNDYEDDDIGDGGDAPNADDNPAAYSYPTDAVFLGTEADILEWRVTGDEANNKLCFLVRLAYNTVWVPIIGIACDLDHISGKGMDDAGLYSQVRLNPINSWEYLIRFVNMGVTVFDTLWNVVPGTHSNWFSTDNDLIEVCVDVSNWSPSPWGMTVYFTVYAGLNEWDNCRPVYDNASQWYGGGGCAGGVCLNPRVYDLIFCSVSQQIADLSNYTNTSWTELAASTVGAINMNLISGAAGGGGDNSPLPYGGYNASTPAQIHIYAQMAGVAFSIDETTWDLTEGGTYTLRPNEFAIRGGTTPSPSLPFLLQNDGGVFIDLWFNTEDTYPDPAHIWSPYPLIDPFDPMTFPGPNSYFIEPWITDVGDPAPDTLTDFSGIGLTEIDEEATSENWAYYYSNANSSGLNIPAYKPTDPTNGDRISIYMLFMAPAFSTTLDPHEITIGITAQLSSP